MTLLAVAWILTCRSIVFLIVKLRNVTLGTERGSKHSKTLDSSSVFIFLYDTLDTEYLGNICKF